jgi:hypothetical protein
MSGKELFTYKKVTVSGLFLLVGELFLLVGRLFLLVVIVKNNRQTVMLTYQIQNNLINRPVFLDSGPNFACCWLKNRKSKK